jgi:hypothetical protein
MTKLVETLQIVPDCIDPTILKSELTDAAMAKNPGQNLGYK